MFIAVIIFLISSQALCAGQLISETKYVCSGELQAMYTLLDEKFTLKQEIQKLKDTVDKMQTNMSRLENELKDQARYQYIPGPRVDIAKDFKTVKQSSEYPSPNHPAHLAVDGNLNTFSHTNVETKPWWSMEFCNDVIIATVRLRDRSDCCDDQMTNIVVTVDNEICGEVDRPIGVKESVDVTCPKPLVGKVLKIQRTDTSVLSIAELQVFSSSSAC